ncbi:hypothetical protein AK830_g233 [Neonectria ditissima]|uniref:HNH nuclease domain-containing protein n=1 Tax=Neonectria ditissima TaxID=78410 RepID=A0A0N8H961_9HYPO|nr:hypothetical protein AK830_g233 [Neonectria ditissima]
MDAPHRELRERLTKLVNEFLDRPVVHSSVTASIERLLQDDPPFEQPQQILPIHEAEMRSDFARNIERRIRVIDEEYTLSAHDFAFIMMVPLSVLQPGGAFSESQGSIFIQDLLSQSYDLTGHCKFFLKRLTDKHKAELASQAGVSPLPEEIIRRSKRNKKTPQDVPAQTEHHDESENDADSIESGSEYNPGSVRRVNHEKTKCRGRDRHFCVIMGTRNPDACHIVPFKWNDTQAAICITRTVRSACGLLMGNKWLEDNVRLLCNRAEPGSSDKVWNMLCLNRQLHAWWPKCYFAFKCLGAIPIPDDNNPYRMTDNVSVRLQFYWLPHYHGRKNTSMNIDNWRTWVDDVVAFQRNGYSPLGSDVAASKAATNFPIISGHIISVVMNKSDGDRFKAMMDLQWALTVIGAMSGGADPPKLKPDLYRKDDDYEVYDESRISSWVQAQARRD